MSNTKPNAKPNAKKAENNYVIVDFLDLKPECFSFNAPKTNKYGGQSAGITYNGKSLWVKYGRRTAPFGLGINTDLDPKKGVGYEGGKKKTGCQLSISLGKDYQSDPYYQKAAELDEFFINQCIKNCVLWGLGGAPGKPVGRDVIAGYDDRGDRGLFKRLIKWSGSKDEKTGIRTYKEYPPNMTFSVPTGEFTESEGENGKHQVADLKVKFFDAEGNEMETVNTDNKDDAVPNYSQISILSQWPYIALGTYGASLKPRLQQARVFPGSGMPDTDTCHLDDDDDEDAADMPNMLGGGAPIELSAPKARAGAAVAPDETYVEEGVELEPEEVVLEQPPAPAAKRTLPAVKTKAPVAAAVEVDEELSVAPVAAAPVRRAPKKLQMRTAGADA